VFHARWSRWRRGAPEHWMLGGLSSAQQVAKPLECRLLSWPIAWARIEVWYGQARARANRSRAWGLAEPTSPERRQGRA